MWKDEERQADTVRECKHSETHRSQIPRPSIKRPRLRTQQSTPHNPAHGLHTIHTLLFPSWKHILTSTHALSRIHTPSTPTRNHWNAAFIIQHSARLVSVQEQNKWVLFQVLSSGWFKGDAAATVLWFVTCHRAKDIFHNPQPREQRGTRKWGILSCPSEA